MPSQQVIPPHIAPDADGTFDSHYYAKAAADALLAAKANQSDLGAKADQTALDTTNANVTALTPAANEVVAGPAKKLALGAGKYPKGDGTNVVAGDFATDVAATAAVTANTTNIAAVTPGAGQVIIGATPPIKANGPVNVKANGAKGDGVTGDQTAFQGATIAAGSSRRTDVPTGTYAMSGQYVLRGGTIHLRGDGTSSTVVKPSTAFSNLWLSSPAYGIDRLIIEDITFDMANTNVGNVLNLGFEVGDVSIRRCRFLRPGGSTFIAAKGARRFEVEDCHFSSDGDWSGTGIGITGPATGDTVIRNNRFLWLQNGIILAGVVGSDTQDIVEHCVIDGNYFDGFWWLGKAQAGYTNSGATVTYTSGGLTDTAKDFSGVTGIGTGTYKVTVRAMPALITLVGTWTRQKFSGTGLSIISSGVKRGHIIRDGSGKYWAPVATVVSENELDIEGWFQTADGKPAPNGTTIMADSTNPIVVYGVYTGTIGSYTATTLSMVNGWTDLDGNIVTPPAGTPYEVMLPHPNYHLNVNQAARDLRIVNNTFRRGWSDQCSTFAGGVQILGNLIEDGEDMGITLNDGGNGVGSPIVAHNTIKHQGVGGIYCTAADAVITGNHIHRWQWTNPNNGAGHAILVAGQDTVVANNVLNGESMAGSKYGVIVATGSGIELLDNKIKNLSATGGAAQVKYRNTPASPLHIRGAVNTIDHAQLSPAGTAPGGFYELRGSGSPEGVVTAGPGSTWLDLTNGTLYVKHTGTGNTGWVVQA